MSTDKTTKVLLAIIAIALSRIALSLWIPPGALQAQVVQAPPSQAGLPTDMRRVANGMDALNQTVDSLNRTADALNRSVDSLNQKLELNSRAGGGTIGEKIKDTERLMEGIDGRIRLIDSNVDRIMRSVASVDQIRIDVGGIRQRQER